MSEILMFSTAIRDRANLLRACDRMRQAGLDVHVEDASATPVQIKLPGWIKACTFHCDETGRMDADNYSPYYDERRIDVLGNRIDGTGRVHPEVKAGRKRVGDDGQWGEIRWLDRLNVEYGAATVLHKAELERHTVSRCEYDAGRNQYHISVETGEEVVYA